MSMFYKYLEVWDTLVKSEHVKMFKQDNYHLGELDNIYDVPVILPKG